MEDKGILCCPASPLLYLKGLERMLGVETVSSVPSFGNAMQLDVGGAITQVAVRWLTPVHTPSMGCRKDTHIEVSALCIHIWCILVIIEE